MRNIADIRAFALWVLLTKDGLGKGLSNVQHCIVADSLKTDLYRAGFVTNKDRWEWTPGQRFDSQLWEPSEPPRSTNWRKRDLESFAPVLVGSLVKWSTDSQAAARIIELESMELGLHRLAVTWISQFCAEHSTRLEVQWFPRTESEKMDYISHLVDFDDWQVTRNFFISLEDLWGPHTLDSFRISGAWVRQWLTSLRKI